MAVLPHLDRRSVWRWHFYAGVLCLPVVAALSITGSIYLFKPQIDAWQDAAYDDAVAAAATIRGSSRAAADAQVAAVTAGLPGSTFVAYELPPRPQSAARVVVDDADGTRRLAFVDPQSATLLGSVAVDARITEFVKAIHGELLLGTGGSLLVELAACWAIVLIGTGLWLWWPRQLRGSGGIWWPRFALRGRPFWRDVHAVTGVWVSTLALFLLVSGLPWATVWGEGFKQVRALTGTAAARQDWSLSRASEHAEHARQPHSAAGSDDAIATGSVGLDAIVVQAAALALPPPVRITRDGEDWQVQSLVQNRPLRTTLWFSGEDGRLLRREDFVDRHVIDRIVGFGIAAHEGQLFGLANQLLGVATALGLVTLCASGLVMWWRRRPQGELGAPPAPAQAAAVPWLLVAVIAVLLPVLGLSLLPLWLIDVVLPRIAPPAARWLGIVTLQRPSAAG